MDLDIRIARISEDITIRASPDEIWAVVGDPERQWEWFPGMASSTVEGDVRTVELLTGMRILEQLLEVNPDQRYLKYRITAPIQFDHHLGVIEVKKLDMGSRVIYRQELSPTALTYVFRSAVQDALASVSYTHLTLPTTPYV